jgi:DNA mismatch endonuclease (patch repair protein)
VPKQNRSYWVAKVSRNKARDVVSQRALKAAGWRTLVLWECELKDRARLEAHVQRFLARTGSRSVPPKS